MKPSQVWFEIIGTTAKQDSIGGVAGYDTKAYGGSVGFELVNSEGFVAGISLGVVSADMDTQGGGGSTESETYSLGVYAQAERKNGLIFNAQYSINFGDISVSQIVGGSPSTADTNSFSFAIESGVSKIYNLSENLLLQPNIKLGYASVSIDGYSNSGQTFSDNDSDSLASTLGVDLIYNQDNWSAKLGLGWRHEFNDDANTVTVKYDSGLLFDVAGLEPGDDNFLLDANYSYKIDEKITIDLGYQLDLAKEYVGHTVSANVKWAF